jgi:hypothetical protein
MATNKAMHPKATMNKSLSTVQETIVNNAIATSRTVAIILKSLEYLPVDIIFTYFFSTKVFFRLGCLFFAVGT